MIDTPAGLSPVNRPVTLPELAAVLRMPAARLDRLAARHGIAPACRVAGTRLYGPAQIRRLFAALGPRPGDA